MIKKYLALLVFFTAIGLIIGNSACYGEDWPMYLKDQLHSSVSEEEVKLPLGLYLKLPMAEGVAYSILVDDILYIALNENIYAYNSKTGRQLWKASLPDYLCSTPLYYQGNIYVGSTDYNLYALSISGQILWKFQTSSPVNSSAAGENNRIFFGSFDGFVYAIDAVNGKLIWKYKIGGWLPADGIVSSPLINNGILYIGGIDGNVYALKTDSGELVWKFNGSSRIESSPVFDDGRIYIGSNEGNLYAINAFNGEEIFQFHAEGTVKSSPLVVGEVVIFASGNGVLYALDKLNGTLVWQQGLGMDLKYISCVACGDLVFAIDSQGISARKVENAEIVWNYKVERADMESFLLIADKKFFIKAGKDLFCFSAERLNPEKRSAGDDGE